MREDSEVVSGKAFEQSAERRGGAVSSSASQRSPARRSVGSAAAAPASGGRHMPGVSLMNERVAIKKLPFLSALLIPPVRRSRHPRPARRRSTVRSGSAKPNAKGATFQVAGTKHWLCDFELPAGEVGGGGGSCATLADVRRMDELSIDSCDGSHQLPHPGPGPERRHRRRGRTLRRLDHAHDPGRRQHPRLLDRPRGRHPARRRRRGRGTHRTQSLPLAGPSGSSRGGCFGYVFTEVKPKPSSVGRRRRVLLPLRGSGGSRRRGRSRCRSRRRRRSRRGCRAWRRRPAGGRRRRAG